MSCSCHGEEAVISREEFVPACMSGSFVHANDFFEKVYFSQASALSALPLSSSMVISLVDQAD